MHWHPGTCGSQPYMMYSANQWPLQRQCTDFTARGFSPSQDLLVHTLCPWCLLSCLEVFAGYQTLFPDHKQPLPVAFSPFTENSRSSLTPAWGHEPCPEVSLLRGPPAEAASQNPLSLERFLIPLLENYSLTLSRLFFNSQLFPATCGFTLTEGHHFSYRSFLGSPLLTLEKSVHCLQCNIPATLWRFWDTSCVGFYSAFPITLQILCNALLPN